MGKYTIMELITSCLRTCARREVDHGLYWALWKPILPAGSIYSTVGYEIQSVLSSTHVSVTTDNLYAPNVRTLEMR